MLNVENKTKFICNMHKTLKYKDKMHKNKNKNMFKIADK